MGWVGVFTDDGAAWSELARYSGDSIYGEGVELQHEASPEWTIATWKKAGISLGGCSGIARLRLSLEVDQNISDKG
jgi:hypothetical protein